MMQDKPLIFVTNDDGFLAKGIQALVNAVKPYGDVVVISPERPNSGMSGAITVSVPLRCIPLKTEENVTHYYCTGTPVDCVKLGLNMILDRKPDLIVSGINHGSNAAVSVLYSGTVGAALEGCVSGVPSLAFSLCDYMADADFSQAEVVVAKVVEQVLTRGLPKGICLNVNIPKGEVKGLMLASQTQGKWVNEYKKGEDGVGRDVYWMTGMFENFEKDNKSSDEWILANGFASIVPLKIDMTAYSFFEELKNWEW